MVEIIVLSGAGSQSPNIFGEMAGIDGDRVDYLSKQCRFLLFFFFFQEKLVDAKKKKKTNHVRGAQM